MPPIFGSDRICGFRGCRNQNINCQNEEDCTVTCSGFDACEGSTINCPTNGQCTIHCTDNNACNAVTINGQPNTILIINCDAESACQNSKVNGKKNQDIMITCDQDFGCYQATFNASTANKLTLLDCGQGSTLYTCVGITVWCPPNIKGTKQCILQGTLYSVCYMFLLRTSEKHKKHITKLK